MVRGSGSAAALLAFTYGTVVVAEDDGAAVFDARQRVVLRRDRSAEDECAARLDQLGVRRTFTWRVAPGAAITRAAAATRSPGS